MMLDANQLASVLKERGLLDEIERVFQHKESKLRFGAKPEKSGKKELMGNDLRQKFGMSVMLWVLTCRGCFVFLSIFFCDGYRYQSIALQSRNH